MDQPLVATASKRPKMADFVAYADSLRSLLKEICRSGRIDEYMRQLKPNLNGYASTELRRLVDISTLRDSGAFFTGELLAKRLVQKLSSKALLKRQICDPTCGSGDLLLRWAEKLPIRPTLDETISEWGQKLIGTDIHFEFVEVAKLRLILLALSMGATVPLTPPDLNKVFPNITSGSALDPLWMPPCNGTLLLNPPFNPSLAPANCTWARGKVSSAGLIFMHCIEKCASGSNIAAILPDVLRSGSRYSKWRARVESILKIDVLEVVGRFDSMTDVDVFMIKGQVKAGRKIKPEWQTRIAARKTTKVGDKFDVHVGPLVAYREPKKGAFRSYLTAMDVVNGARITNTNEKRRYSGRLVAPPFVAIQRTSSPTDLNRPVASLVEGETSMAVENHVITLHPKAGGKQACKTLMKSLKDDRTKEWLNKTIRCRHLTVGALRELPIWPSHSTSG